MEERAFPFGSEQPLAIRLSHLQDMVKNAAKVQEHHTRKPQSKGGIAIIPIHGTLATFDIPEFGITSMRRIGASLDAAVADRHVGAIVLHVDSPGGSSTGTPELADKIFSATHTSKKPIIAIADSQAASAAYWTASAADQLVVTTSGEVGSIGVWTMHEDVSGYMEKLGRKVEIISAGKYKVEGHPLVPLDDEARKEMQRSVNETYNDFVDAVARHRGYSADYVKRNFGQGRMLEGKRALRVGMVDGITTFDSLIHDLTMAGEYRGAVRQFANDSPLTKMLCEAWDGNSDITSRVLSPERMNDCGQLRLAERSVRENDPPRTNWHYVSEQQKNEDELALARAEMAEFELDEMMTKYGLK